MLKKSKKINLSSISTRIFLSILLCTIITSSIVGVISLIRSMEIIKQESNDKLKYMAESFANDFNMDFKRVENITDSLEYIITSQIDMDKLENDPDYLQGFKMSLAPIVKELAEKASSAHSAYIYFNYNLTGKEHDLYFIDHDGDGEVTRQEEVSASYFKEGPTKDDPKAWWFEPVNQKKGIWTNPYEWVFDDNTSAIFVSYTKPVFIDNKLIAVVGTDFMFDDMSKIISQIKVYNSGYAYLMNDNYDFIVHPFFDENQNIKDVEDGRLSVIANELMNDGNKTLEYTLDETGEEITSFVKMSNGWTFAIAAKRAEVFKKVKDLQYLVILVILIGGLLSFFIAFSLGKIISNPIKSSFKYLEGIAEGDFSKAFSGKFFNRKDEIGSLGKALAKMQNNIKELIRNTKMVMDDMADTSNTLASVSEETSVSAEQISVTVEEIAKGASEQAVDAEKGVALILELEDSMKKLVQGSGEMLASAEKATEENLNSVESLEALKFRNKLNNESINKIEAAIEKLNHRSESIGNILETISSIAEQTNLLSLNASIEAARAGESGRGFAVVANEIRKLAEESSISADKIRDIVIDIQTESSNTSNIMEEVKNSSKEQTESVEAVNDTINRISKAIEGISNKINSMNEFINSMDENKNAIVVSIQNIASVSEETAAASEEISASMQQQTTSVEEVAQLSENLNDFSHKLQRNIDKFKI